MKLLLTFFDRAIVVRIAAVALLIVAAEYLGIGLILPFVTLATAPDGFSGSQTLARLYAWSGATSRQQFVLVLSAGFFTVFVIKTLITLRLYRWNAFLTTAANRRLADRMVRETLAADYRVFIERSPSTFVGTMRSHVEYATQALVAMTSVMTEGVLLVLLFALALWLNPRLTAFLAGALLVLTVLLKRFVVDRMQAFGRRRNELSTRWEHLTFGVITAVRDIKIMGFETQVQRQFSRIIADYSDVAARHLSLQAAPKLIGELFLVQVVVGCVCFVHLSHIDLTGNLAVLATFAIVLLRMVPSVHKIYNSLGHFRYCHASLQALGENSQYLRGHDRVIATSTTPFAESMAFVGIGFTYPNGTAPALTDVSVTIPKNKFVGIVGRSGSGKSTFLDVLAGLLQASTGEAFLDGVKIDPFGSDAVRRLIGYVPQQVTLLDESLGYNISLEPDYREHLDRVMAAAKAANIHEFIMGLPDGYDAPAGEGGVRMSGGQRQRVGIARALYKSPEILLCDEATSAVDTITEQQIMQSVLELSRAKTILFATHRLQLVENCDLIVVFDRGRVVGSGSHQELLSRCPVYQSMHRNAGAEAPR